MCLAIDAENTVEIWGFYFGIIYHILEIRFGIFLRAAMKKNQIDWFEIETGTLCKSNMAWLENHPFTSMFFHKS